MAIEKYVESENLVKDKTIGDYELLLEQSPANTDVMNILGCLYLELEAKDDDELESNRATAREYFEGAKNLKHAGAEYNLWLLDMAILSELAEAFEDCGYCHEKGIEEGDKGIPNLDKAIEMYEYAISRYDELIYALNNEPPRYHAVSEEYKKMITDNKQRAEINKQRAETNKQRAEIRNVVRLRNLDLGNKLYNAALEFEKGVKNNGNPNYADVIKKYRLAKKYGDKRADAALLRLRGELFKKANELYENKIIEGAVLLYKYAAQLGHQDAKVILEKVDFKTELYDAAVKAEKEAASKEEPNYYLAIRIYNIAKKRGDKRAGEAIARLANELFKEAGVLYREGEITKAVNLYSYVTKLGHVSSMLTLGLLYETGEANDGVPDYREAVRFYEMAKRQGYKRADKALDRLANVLFNKAYELYENGRIEEAIPLYQYAAILGHSKAMEKLGLSYETGEANNGEPNFEKALACYDAAIHRGSTLALINKGHMYERGDADNGVPNYKLAAVLYTRAMERGNKCAKDKLDVLKKKMGEAASSKKRESPISSSETDKENIAPVISETSFPSHKKRKYEGEEVEMKTLAPTYDRGEGNNPNIVSGQLPQKRQKTMQIWGEYPVSGAPENITGNRNVTFYSPVIKRKPPAIFSAPPLKKQKTADAIPVISNAR